MLNLLAIGDPIVDTHVQIDDSSADCQLIPHGNLKLCLNYGQKIPILHSFQNLGGNAANVSVGAVRLGLKSGILSTIGHDVNGDKVLTDLKKAGVNTFYLTPDKNAQTRYSIVLNYKEERTILSFSDKKKYFWPNPAPATDWIYYSGLSEGFEELQENLIKHLKKHKTVKLAFNPGSYLLKYGKNYISDVLKHTDLLIVNLEEAETILGTTLKKEKSVTALMRLLLKKGPTEVALTDAERGAWAGNIDTIWHMKALPVQVVSKTGAGDAFSAGYIAARVYNHDINHALAWGVANSAHVIKHLGSTAGLANKEEVLALLRHFKTIHPFEV